MVAPTASPLLRELQVLVQGFARMPGGLIPALHAVQHRAGYIDRDLIPSIANTFNITVAEVHGVISFYKDFRTLPPAGPIVKVCRGEACQAFGGRDVWARAQAAASGKAVHVEEVFCLGNCALGPSVSINDRLIGCVSAEKIDGVIAGAIANNAPATVAVRQPDSGVIVYVPRDAASRAVGADEVAAAIAALPGARVIRNGSRGMLWLEPMIEVETPAGRIAYGPVTAADVPGLIAADLLAGGDHKLRLGAANDLPWMKRQQRITFTRVGLVDPRSADDYEKHGGTRGLRAAMALEPAQVVKTVLDSGLRGRGGAAFPTGIKWKTVLDAPGPTKFIVCNADEGDSGTFADRMLMEGDPFSLIEGMAIAAHAVGAHEGYVYIRSEYPDAVDAMRAAVDAARQRGWLGSDVLNTGFAFDLHVRVGAGAYICGEETSLLESLEGRRGEVRAKPPLPAVEGLFGKPTVVNNVISLATVPAILADGAAAYAAIGVGRSRGTQVFQLAGNIAQGGIFETAFGVSLGELVNDIGGGTATGKPIRAIQVGGPLGSYVPASQLHLPLDYEAFAAADALVGHGGIVVFDDTVDMAAQARFAMEFCAIESCGKCTPCRVGSMRGVEVIDKITVGDDAAGNMTLLLDLCELMTDGSMCAMGGLTPLPVKSALKHFAEDFQPKPALQRGRA